MTQTVPARKVVAGDNDRERFDEEALAALASSIDRNGLLQEITVRPVGDELELICGERRFRAMVDHLGWADVPAKVIDVDDETASAIMLTENVGRVDLDPIEEALAYSKRMEAQEMAAGEMADVAGVSAQRVRARLKLLELVEEGRQLVRRGDLKKGWADPLSKLDANRQRIALRAYVQEAMTFGEWRALCDKLLEDQLQDRMFDSDQFTVDEYVAEAKAEAQPWGRQGVIDLLRNVVDATHATDPDLPDELADAIREAGAFLVREDS